MVNLGLPFTIEELLKFWQSTWFQLSETQQQKFLKQPEALAICEWPGTDVKKFLTSEKKLRIVLMELIAEDQRIEEINRIRRIESERSVLEFQLETKGLLIASKSWCPSCSCNHLPGQHHDLGSYR